MAIEEKVKNRPDLVRLDRGAVVSKDNDALQAYKKQKNKFKLINNLEKKIINLETRVSNIEKMLAEILTKIGK